MTIIVITGTPGAGKTTVLKAAIQKLRKKVDVVNYADKMLEASDSVGIGKDHDAIRKLPLENQRQLQKMAAQMIARTKGTVIVDTHCTIKTDKGYLPGLPEWVVKALKPVTIVLVEADPKEIVGRRGKDKSRKRDDEALSEIKFHQNLNRAVGAACATLSGATLKILENHDNGLDKAASELAKILEEV